MERRPGRVTVDVRSIWIRVGEQNYEAHIEAIEAGPEIMRITLVAVPEKEKVTEETGTDEGGSRPAGSMVGSGADDEEGDV